MVEMWVGESYNGSGACMQIEQTRSWYQLVRTIALPQRVDDQPRPWRYTHQDAFAESWAKDNQMQKLRI